MIKSIILICTMAITWYAGYCTGYDRGYKDGVQNERDEWQLRNMRAAMRIIGGKHGKDENVDQ